MATEKTPAHKRISRAENSAAEWKMKAIERREANEALQEQLATVLAKINIAHKANDEFTKRCANLEKQVKELAEQVRVADQTITKQQAEIDEFKKKACR